MKFFSLILIFCSFISLALAIEAENNLFDSNRTSANELLQKEYKNSKLLLMGFASHRNHQHINQLRDLLKTIGTDPNLKFIVLERAGDLSEFYERLSTNDLKTTLKQFKFKDKASKKQSLCFGEWAYAIDQLLPEIREVNKLRPLNNPIIVKTVDGMQSTMDETWPGLGKPIHKGNCKVKDLTVPPIYNVSSNREVDTAKTFSNEIWNKLGPSDKVIALYNRGHLVSSFKACTPFMISTERFEARYSDLAWIDSFYDLNPEAKEQASLVVLDEKYDEIKDGTTFEFSRRQSIRFPGEDWAIELGQFSEILKETGLDMITKTSDFRARMNNTATSLPLPEIARGLIWNSKAYILYRNQSGADYPSTREYCSDN